MNKQIIIFLLTFSCVSLLGETRYNPTTQKYYTEPNSPEINQEEYNELMSALMPHFNDLFFEERASFFLRVAGTPAALRLLNDIKLLKKTIREDAKAMRG